jgi:hypothetical protein
MIEPYAIVGLSPRTFTVEKREDALANVKRICKFMETACMVGAWEGFPVRLVVIPEMAIQGLVANTPGNRAVEAKFAGKPKNLTPTSRPNCTWCGTMIFRTDITTWALS